MEQEIKQLKQLLDRQQEELSNLKRHVSILGTNTLNQNLDFASKSKIEEVVSERFFDIFWNDYYYYSSAFEGVDRYLAGGTGWTGVTDNGLVLETNAAIGGAAYASLGVDLFAKLMRFDKETKFRCHAKIDTVANTILRLLTIVDGTDNYIGFEINDGVVYGLSSNRVSGESKITIGTLSDDEVKELELAYYPSRRVDFLLNGRVVGSSTANFPQDDNSDHLIFDAILETKNAAKKVATLLFWEFLQKK